MRRVRSILMDIANHPKLRVDGVQMEKVEISHLGLGVQYGILAHDMDRDICNLYVQDKRIYSKLKNTIVVLDDVDPELKGEALHGSKYGRCPCTFRRVLEQIVRFDPDLAMEELNVLNNNYSVETEYKNGIYKEKREYTLYIPRNWSPEIIKVHKTVVDGKERIYIDTHD